MIIDVTHFILVEIFHLFLAQKCIHYVLLLPVITLKGFFVIGLYGSIIATVKDWFSPR